MRGCLTCGGLLAGRISTPRCVLHTHNHTLRGCTNEKRSRIIVFKSFLPMSDFHMGVNLIFSESGFGQQLELLRNSRSPDFYRFKNY